MFIDREEVLKTLYSSVDSIFNDFEKKKKKNNKLSNSETLVNTIEYFSSIDTYDIYLIAINLYLYTHKNRSPIELSIASVYNIYSILSKDKNVNIIPIVFGNLVPYIKGKINNNKTLKDIILGLVKKSNNNIVPMNILGVNASLSQTSNLTPLIGTYFWQKYIWSINKYSDYTISYVYEYEESLSLFIEMFNNIETMLNYQENIFRETSKIQAQIEDIIHSLNKISEKHFNWPFETVLYTLYNYDLSDIIALGKEENILDNKSAIIIKEFKEFIKILNIYFTFYRTLYNDFPNNKKQAESAIKEKIKLLANSYLNRKSILNKKEKEIILLSIPLIFNLFPKILSYEMVPDEYSYISVFGGWELLNKKINELSLLKQEKENLYSFYYNTAKELKTFGENIKFENYKYIWDDINIDYIENIIKSIFKNYSSAYVNFKVEFKI